MKKKHQRMLGAIQKQEAAKPEPINEIVIVGYKVKDNIAYYTVEVGKGNALQVMSYTELSLAETLHQVPTLYAIGEPES